MSMKPEAQILDRYSADLPRYDNARLPPPEGASNNGRRDTQTSGLLDDM